MRKTDTREILIEEGLKALLASGYDGVGIGPVLKAAGVPKGSFYHFFESKEAFAEAVLATYARRSEEERARLLGDDGTPPLERLRRYFAFRERQFAADEAMGGCLIGSLAQSIATRSDVLRRELKSAFDEWERDLRQVLREARDRGELSGAIDPDAAAAFLIDAYEGALIRMKAEGSIAPLRRFIAFTLDHLLSPEK